MPSEPTRVEIDRARLHRAAWEAPVPKAAHSLKVTPPTLRRMVEILDVPLPGHGSWRTAVRTTLLRVKTPMAGRRGDPATP